VAGARFLGLDASAALVSTTHGVSLNDFLPSAQVFNHVIVRLRIGERIYWLDPTLPSQTGSLDQVTLPHAGWALPLTPGTGALEALPKQETVDLAHCEDRITLGPKPDSVAHLERRMTLGFWAADNVRHRIANEGTSKLAEQLLQDLIATWPKAVESKPLSLEEDVRNNKLMMTSGYDIPDPWVIAPTARRWNLPLTDPLTNKELPVLRVARRHSPILLGRPRRVSCRVTVEMPTRWAGKGWHQDVNEAGLQFINDLELGGREVVLERKLIIGTASMASNQSDAYLRVVTKANQNVTQLFGRVAFGRIVSPITPWRRLMTSQWRRAIVTGIAIILYAIFMLAVSHK
jgi:hypothetical protein